MRNNDDIRRRNLFIENRTGVGEGFAEEQKSLQLIGDGIAPSFGHRIERKDRHAAGLLDDQRDCIAVNQ